MCTNEFLNRIAAVASYMSYRIWRLGLAEAKMFAMQFGPDFFIIKPTRCTDFPNLLRHEILHVSGSSSVHHQEFIHCILGTGICHTGLKTALEQDQDGTAGLSWSCSKAVFIHV